MIILITMAGKGQRFLDAGYNVPKYMIEVNSKTLFEWSMSSLQGYNDKTTKYIFVCRKENNSENFIKDIMKNKFGFSNLEIVELEKSTDGQATSAYLGLLNSDEEESLLIFNIDTYVEPFELKYADLKGDGFIPCFEADGSHWSFVKGKNGKAEEVVEKNRISSNCSIGVYYFKSVKLFKKTYNDFFIKYNLNKYPEKYIAPMYEYLIREGYEVDYNILNKDKVHVLGTPEELLNFKKIKDEKN